ncbi:9205_t:CDS:2, partial [Dentiscutata erythropus]
NKPDIRRVVSKSKEGFCTEKWLVSKEEKESKKVLDMMQSSLEEIRKNNIDIGITSRKKIGRDSYSLEHASLANIVYIDKLERDYIKKQEFSKYCEGLLLNQLERNIETDQKILTFYTDGLLLKEMRNGRAVCKQGLGWLQIDKNEKKQVTEELLSIEHWPSLTRAKLAVIWIVLLAIKKGEGLRMNREWLK